MSEYLFKYELLRQARNIDEYLHLPRKSGVLRGPGTSTCASGWSDAGVGVGMLVGPSEGCFKKFRMLLDLILSS